MPVDGTRIGVYVCHCGINIAHGVDVKTVSEHASALPNVVVARDYTYMCSDPGQNLIKNDIVDRGLTAVVVASCSPLMHEATFRSAAEEAGVNPYRVEIANIREQCSWVHDPGEAATIKASQLVSSAVARCNLLEDLFRRKAKVVPRALVLGAGVAGLQAALDIAEAGFSVCLVEQDDEVGGHAVQLSRTFPTHGLVSDLLSPMVNRVLQHPLIHLMTQSQVADVSGYYGNFEVEIYSPNKGVVSQTFGVIVVATGYDLFDAHRKPELGFGIYPEVITSMEFERLSSGDGPSEGELEVNGRSPKNIVFIQCVGSRDRQMGNAHCSRICCMYTAKQASIALEKLPDADVCVFYTDIRAFGKGFEEFYDQVREQGVFYRRGTPSEIIRDPRGGGLLVRAEDTLLGQPIEVQADLVVLAIGIEPRVSTGDVTSLLRLSNSADGFIAEAHPKLRPVDTAVAGVFLAGCCQGPKDISDSIAQARAAASAALAPLIRGRVNIEAVTASVDEDLCAGCGVCLTHCLYGALEIHPVFGVMTVNDVLCQGCGACAAACPNGAAQLQHYTFDQTLAQVDALTGGLGSGF